MSACSKKHPWPVGREGCIWRLIQPITGSTSGSRETTFCGYGAYVGAGGAGADNPCTITVPFKPVLVAVKGSQFSTYLLVAVRESLIGNTASTSNSYYEAHLTWSEDSLSWYCGNELGQLNTSGETYHYVAIG